MAAMDIKSETSGRKSDSVNRCVPTLCLKKMRKLSNGIAQNLQKTLEQSLHVSVFVCVCFLADRTATQYDRLLASSCCPSVCPSVRLSVSDAVHCGSQGWCTGLKVIPACS